MKLTLFTILALCIIAVCQSAEEEYEYDEEAAAPVTPAPTKPAGGRLGGLLSSRGRANVANVGKKKAPTQSTTTKPVEQAPEEGEEVEGEDALDENQEHEEPTTTTESAKKLRNGVRPFRSNEDLLAALKRRRAQTGSSSHSREIATTHSAVEQTTVKSKVSTNSPGNRSKPSAGNETKTSGRGRFGGKGKIIQEEVEETQRDEVQVKPKASPYRRRS